VGIFFFGNVDAESLLSNQWEGTGNRCFFITSKKEADIKVFDIFLLCNRNLTVISQLYKQVKWWLKRRWFLVSTDTYTKAENTKFKENPQHLPHGIERPGSKHLFSSVLPHQWSEIRLSLLFIFFLRSYQAAWELLVNTVSAGKVEYRIWLKFYDNCNHLFILINQIDLYESKNNFPHFLHCKSGIYQSWKKISFLWNQNRNCHTLWKIFTCRGCFDTAQLLMQDSFLKHSSMFVLLCFANWF